MIFVTVGTHEQQFDRLIEYIDNLVKDKIIKDEVIMQIGYSTYEPRFCKWSRIMSYDQIKKNIENAKIIICHGGPSSFIMPLKIGKVPIVVPRQLKFKEHVNDHQVDFIRDITERLGTIIPIYNIEDLRDLIVNYEKIVKIIDKNRVFNNELFCNKFIKLIDEMSGE